MIRPDDLQGVDGLTARRLLVRARSVAPGLDLIEGDAREDAIAILIGVASEIPEAGSRRMRSMSRNGTSVTMDPFASAFSDEDIALLRSLCPPVPPAGVPVGSFPEAGIIARLWPEKEAR